MRKSIEVILPIVLMIILGEMSSESLRREKLKRFLKGKLVMTPKSKKRIGRLAKMQQGR